MSYEWTSNRIWNISGILTEYGNIHGIFVESSWNINGAWNISGILT